MKCTACGRENSQEAEFCGGCGAKLTSAAPLTFDWPAVKVDSPSPNPSPNPSRDDKRPQTAPPSSNTASNVQTAVQSVGLYLVCTAGPDKGKRMAVGEQEITLGRSLQCGLLSDDPDVSERHVVFFAHKGQMHFRSLSTDFIFVDGTGQADGVLTLNNQIRIGRSFWQMEAATSKVTPAVSLFDRVGERVSLVTGVSKVEGFNAQEMFSSVLETRTDEDIEEYFLVGTRTTTPDLKDVSTTWPKPWVFFKTFTLSLLIYIGFYLAWNQFENPNMLPGLMVMGAFAIPISVVIFYFEMNTPRNVSLYQVFKLMFTGGILSMIATLFLGNVLKGSASTITGALLTGIAEETGKVMALLLVVNKIKYRWTLNGLLLGGAVGAGFAGFESAGYSFVALLRSHSDSTMFQTILWRGLLAPGGHVAWAALCGAALWKVKGNDRFVFSMLQDRRFLRVFGLAVALHGLWDVPFDPPYFLKEIVLTGIAWVAILSFVQDGLKQIQAVQAQQRPEARQQETVS